MKKNSVRWWIALVVLWVIYNVIVFALPFQKTPIFFISYLFTLAAIGVQVYVIRTAFYKGLGVKSKFFGFPIARIGVLYLIAQLVLGMIFMGLGTAIPARVPLVLFILLLGISIVSFISADAIRDEIGRQDMKLQKDVSCMRALQSKATTIIGQTQDQELLQEAQKFFEALRYSDPVSGEAIQEIERELTICVDEIQTAVADGDQDGASALLKRADTLLSERNRLCKLNK